MPLHRELDFRRQFGADVRPELRLRSHFGGAVLQVAFTTKTPVSGLERRFLVWRSGHPAPAPITRHQRGGAGTFPTAAGRIDMAM